MTLGGGGDLRADRLGYLRRGSRATEITGVQRRIRSDVFDGSHHDAVQFGALEWLEEIVD